VYTNSRNAAHAYANVGLETGVVAASPQRLIIMLYEGAELAVRVAIRHMKEGDIAKKSAAITKATTIILEGLRAALDPQGGEIAQQLDALYDYMIKRLMLAHVRNEIAPLEEVLGLLQELRGAWQAIDAVRAAPANASLHPLAA
jgi:flagellar protein FliS